MNRFSAYKPPPLRHIAVHIRSALPALLAVVMLIVACQGVSAAVYRVDGINGDDANDGITAPFKTIARALRSLQTSDTLILTKMDEPYRESLPLNVGGVPGAPLIIDGGGATLSGADTAPRDGWTQDGAVFTLEEARRVHFLFGPDIRYEQAASVEALEPLQWWWEDGVLSFRPEEGKTPADYILEMSVRVSGVLTNGAGQIIVRNLTCIHFYNDGFNLHGGSGPLWFENIKGLWNGDEGFSAHENCECYVRDAEFSNNYWHGIADVGIARTSYANIKVHNNRSKGIFLIGALHSIIDSEVSGSPVNIDLAPSDLRDFPLLEDHPLRRNVTNLRSVVVQSGPNEIGVQVRSGAEAVIEHCVISGGRVGLQVNDGGVAYVINSIIHGASDAEVAAAGTFRADYNLYHPGIFRIGDQLFSPDDFDRYRETTGNDSASWLEEPRFIDGTWWASRASRAAGNAFNRHGYGGPDIGIEPRGERPPEPDVLPAGARPLPDGGALFAYDFEQEHPWSRIYPEPERNAEDIAVEGVSELSDEVVFSGNRAARLVFRFPDPLPPGGKIKLFSERMGYTRPVRAVRFQLYGDGSGRSLRLRLRDARACNFWDAPIPLDWEGWQLVEWDLRDRPPVLITGADEENAIQTLPPLEIVLEISAVPADAGMESVLYMDDLEIELEP